MFYPATITPHENGEYSVTFVDIPGCIAQGKGIEKALREGEEALSLHLGGMLDYGEKLPAPSTLEEAKFLDEKQRKEDQIDKPEGTFYQYIFCEPDQEKKKDAAVKVSVSMKPRTLDQVDSMAEELGLTRSGILSVAVDTLYTQRKTVRINQ